MPELKTVLPNADFVIEGYVDPTEPLRDEGPFGDHTGYYTLPEPYPVFHVTPSPTAKTPSIPPPSSASRRWKISTSAASRDCGMKLFLPIFKMNFPEIVDLALPAEGVFHNLVFVSIRKTYPMQAYKVLADGHQCTASGAWGR